MKKGFCILLSILLIFSLIGSVPAEETAEYRDEIYSFRYPDSWSLNTAANGDIVLTSPGGNDAVITFAVATDLFRFTGNTVTDAPTIEQYISTYQGKNLVLTGKYESMQSGEMKGFRAFGSWKATGQDAVMIILADGGHMIGFVLVGDEAIALEKDFLDSVEFLGKVPEESKDGFKRWEGSQFALDYPEQYGAMEQNTGVVFINPDDGSNIIMARAYNLDTDYSDDMAPALAAQKLPKSTKVEANPEMVEIGGRKAAEIKGTVSGGPMSFYVFGSGKTAFAMMFTGEEAVGMAEPIIQSVVIVGEQRPTTVNEPKLGNAESERTEPSEETTEPPQPESTEETANPAQTEPDDKPDTVKVGDVIRFGCYPQAADRMSMDPIEWLVLDVQDGKALIISKYGVDAKEYNALNFLPIVDWEISSLRNWLNSDFMDTAFSEEERAAILTTDVENGSEQVYSEWYKGSKFVTTKDRIFALSYTEAQKYLDVTFGAEDNMEGRTGPTAYAIKQGAWHNEDYLTAEGGYTCCWWLRTPSGANLYEGCAVDAVGGLYSCDYSDQLVCVRPACWVDLELYNSVSEIPQSESKPATETFVFRNNITWGMSRDEVKKLENNEDYSEKEENGFAYQEYEGIRFSQYTGELSYLFDLATDRLVLAAYILEDGNQENFDYLQKVYDAKYGEQQEADPQEFKEFIDRNNPEGTTPVDPETFTLSKWVSGDTQIWLILFNDGNHSAIICMYISPELMNAQTTDELDMTGM